MARMMPVSLHVWVNCFRRIEKNAVVGDFRPNG
jgi:hypothetical protein